MFGRRRNIPELKATNKNVAAFGKRVAMNSPIQGTAADIIKIAMIRVSERFKREKLSAKLVLQVHDELIVEAPEADRETACRILTEEMEHAAALRVMEELSEEYEITPILSFSACETDTRFGTSEELSEKIGRITSVAPISTIVESETLAARPLDIMMICPCTGNTAAKLANGITDTPVTMAAKAHLRNGKPLVIAFSTNDGLTGSAQNIAALFNRKNVYLVPYGQDDYAKKPYSLASDFALLDAALEAALDGKQLQPVLI